MLSKQIDGIVKIERHILIFIKYLKKKKKK